MLHHIRNILKYGVPVVVAINSFSHDHQEETELVCRKAKEGGAFAAVIGSHWAEVFI